MKRSLHFEIAEPKDYTFSSPRALSIIPPVLPRNSVPVYGLSAAFFKASRILVLTPLGNLPNSLAKLLVRTDL